MISRQNALKKGQSCWNAGRNHPANQIWRNEYREALAAYDGVSEWAGGRGQWPTKHLDALTTLDQEPLTINRYAPLVDQLCGIETLSRYKAFPRIDRDGEEYRALSAAWQKWIFFIDQSQNIKEKRSLRFKQTNIGGLSWLYLEFLEGVPYVSNVSPLTIIPDWNDLSEQFTAMDYVNRAHYMSTDEVRSRFKNKIPWLNNCNDYEDINYNLDFSKEFLDANQALSPDCNSDGGYQGKLLICETQFKQYEKAYRGITEDGNSFETFDAEQAEKIVNEKSDLQEFQSKRIYKVYFINDILLHFSPLAPSYPGQIDFSYIPYVYKRRPNGVCYGIWPSIKSLQLDMNARYTKALHSIGAHTVILKGYDNMNNDISGTQHIEKQLHKKNGIIKIPSDADIQIINKDIDFKANLTLLEVGDQAVKQTSGIAGELQGQQTNATSGIAIKKREDSSLRNNIPAFDMYAWSIKRDVIHLIKMLQAANIENIYIQGSPEEDTAPIILNMVATDKRGDQWIANNVNFLPISIYIEEALDVDGNRQALAEDARKLLSSENVEVLLKSPTFLELLFGDKAKTMSKELLDAMTGMQQQQMAMSQPVNMPASDQIPPQAQELSPINAFNP